MSQVAASGSDFDVSGLLLQSGAMSQELYESYLAWNTVLKSTDSSSSSNNNSNSKHQQKPFLLLHSQHTFSSTLANGSSNEIVVGPGVDGKVDGSELGEDVSRLLDAGKERTNGSEELGLGDGDERGQMILPGLGKTSGAGKRQWW